MGGNGTGPGGRRIMYTLKKRESGRLDLKRNLPTYLTYPEGNIGKIDKTRDAGRGNRNKNRNRNRGGPDAVLLMRQIPREGKVR